MLKDFTKIPMDIIVLTGQSNAEGSGRGPTANPYVPNEKIYYLNPDFTINIAEEVIRDNEVIASFVLPFAAQYIKNNRLNGRNLLIVKSAVGATGFCDNRWGLKDDLFLRMIEMTRTALSLNVENKLISFLWHQGEHEVGNNITYDVHKKIYYL